MAVDVRDSKNGFRHSDVVKFINEEVFSNGGGPEFYLTFRSQPWNEIENCLKFIVDDPHVSHTIKRACAWSALALGVREAARQREQGAHYARQLYKEVGEQRGACRYLNTKLQKLYEEHNEIALELQRAKQELQYALEERNVLRSRLLQFEQSHPEWQAELQGAEASPWHAEVCRGDASEGDWLVRTQSQMEETQMASPTVMGIESGLPMRQGISHDTEEAPSSQCVKTLFTWASFTQIFVPPKQLQDKEEANVKPRG